MLSVKMEISGANKMVENVATKQLPFAFAHALTLTATDARDEVIRQLPRKFILRTSWWRPQSYIGFKVRAAKKRWLVAEVYTRAYFMRFHEEGGIKKPEKARTISVPTKNIRKVESQRITSIQRPASLLRRAVRPAFVIETKSGPVIFRRVTKKQLLSQYVLTKQAVIKPRLGMHEIAEQILQKNFNENFEKAFINAIKTAR